MSGILGGVQAPTRDRFFAKATRVTVIATFACIALPSAASASTAICNLPITMSDVVVLRANVWLPSPTTAHYSTVLTVTGYNKDATNPTGQACTGTGGLATADTSLADKGYAVMLLDDRGTGASQGQWDSWGQRTQLDYRKRSTGSRRRSGRMGRWRRPAPPTWGSPRSS